jgi:hypothetical protein
MVPPPNLELKKKKISCGKKKKKKVYWSPIRIPHKNKQTSVPPSIRLKQTPVPPLEKRVPMPPKKKKKKKTKESKTGLLASP